MFQKFAQSKNAEYFVRVRDEIERKVFFLSCLKNVSAKKSWQVAKGRPNQPFNLPIQISQLH